MARVNIFIPDELLHSARSAIPNLNVSRLAQDSLRGLMSCDHKEVACARCAVPMELEDLVDGPLSRFYADALWALGELVHAGGTAEGAARVLKDVAERHGVTEAMRMGLPRPSRASRQRWAQQRRGSR